MAAGRSTKVVLAALACNAGIAVAKFTAAAYTGSSAMLSEAIHSVVAASNQALLLYGLRRSGPPSGTKAPVGYAKGLYFWGFTVAILLFSLGAGVTLYEGVEKLQHPRPMQNPEVNYAVLGAAFLLKAASGWFTLTAFNRERGSVPFPAARRARKPTSIFLVLLQDLAAMTGLLIALAGVLAARLGGIPEADGIASIAIGMLLGMVAAVAAIEVKNVLADEGARVERQTDGPGPSTAEAATQPQPAAASIDPTPITAATTTGAPSTADKPQLQARHPQTKKARRKRRR